MQAVILASGLGSRLRPLTDKAPKPLIQVGESSILKKIVDSLIEHEIKDIIVTTGYLEDQIKDFFKAYPELNVEFVKNDIYDKTNYIYSIWLAQDKIKRDFLLFHSDLVFDKCLIKKVIDHPKSGVLINKKTELLKKDFKARVLENRIKEIGVKLFDSDSYNCIPIYKFLYNDWLTFLESIDYSIKQGDVKCYAEDVFNKISEKLEIVPIFFEDEFAMEVDDFEDLEIANKYFLSK